VRQISYRISKSISFTSYNNYYAMISLLLLPLVYYYCTTSYASCAVISLFDSTNTVAKPILLHYLLRLLRHDIPAITYRPATNYSTHDTYNKNIVRSRMHVHITLTLETLVHAHRTPPPLRTLKHAFLTAALRRMVLCAPSLVKDAYFPGFVGRI
jgi:hypothetical protein